MVLAMVRATGGQPGTWGRSPIGSIEPDKWTNLVAIEKDFMTTAAEEFSAINPLLTIACEE